MGDWLSPELISVPAAVTFTPAAKAGTEAVPVFV